MNIFIHRTIKIVFFSLITAIFSSPAYARIPEPIMGTYVVGDDCTIQYQVSWTYSSGNVFKDFGSIAQDVTGFYRYWGIGSVMGGRAFMSFKDEIDSGNNGSSSWKEEVQDFNEGHDEAYRKYTMQVFGPEACKAELRFIWKIESEVDLEGEFIPTGDDVDSVQLVLEAFTKSDCAQQLVDNKIEVTEQTKRVITHGVNFTASIENSAKEGSKVAGSASYQFQEQRTPASSFNVTSRAGVKTQYCDYKLGVGDTRYMYNWGELNFNQLLVRGEPETFGVEEWSRLKDKILDSRVNAELIRIEICKDDDGNDVAVGSNVITQCNSIPDSQWRSIYKELGISTSTSNSTSSRQASISLPGSSRVAMGGVRYANVTFDDDQVWDADVAVQIASVPAGIIGVEDTYILPSGESTLMVPLFGQEMASAVLVAEWNDPEGLSGGSSEEISVVDSTFGVHITGPHMPPIPDSARLDLPEFGAVVGDIINVNIYGYQEFEAPMPIELDFDVFDEVVTVVDPDRLQMKFTSGGLLANFELEAVGAGTTNLHVMIGDEQKVIPIYVMEPTLDVIVTPMVEITTVQPGQEIPVQGIVQHIGSEAIANVDIFTFLPVNASVDMDSIVGLELLEDPETGQQRLGAMLEGLEPDQAYEFSYTLIANTSDALIVNHSNIYNQVQAVHPAFDDFGMAQYAKIHYGSGPGDGNIKPIVLHVNADTSVNDFKMY